MTNFDIEEVNQNYFNGAEKIIIYTKGNNLREVVKSLGYAIDEEGYIITKDTNERVKAIDKSEIKLQEVGVILPHNSPHQFIKNNLGSLAFYLASKE